MSNFKKYLNDIQKNHFYNEEKNLVFIKKLKDMLSEV